MMAAADDAARTSAEAAYDEIKNWILHGDIPLGMRLGEGRVAARLSMSRTPVREALLRLHAERFVDRHPEGGYRINHPTARAMNELYDVRKALELFALRGACAHAVIDGHEAQATLAELRDEWLELASELEQGGGETLVDANFVVLDEAFHSRLAEASGNAELVEALDRVSERIRPVRTHDFVRTGRIEATITQHLEIVEATLDGGPRAQELLERHIDESKSFVEASVGRVLERMLTMREEDLEW